MTAKPLVSGSARLVGLLTAFLLTACSTREVAPPEPATEIEILGNDHMRFSVTEFTVRAGDEITLTLKNVGRMPKESMGHNLAVLDKSVSARPFPLANTHEAGTLWPYEHAKSDRKEAEWAGRGDLGADGDHAGGAGGGGADHPDAAATCRHRA